ncbi:hypothetical protein MRS60_10630 [Burkholderia pyrrocinia]|uniref:hypothetical protein n=1 Tax=Burkholderia pyrrocinia TaxID=60550 RepID=UPI001FB40013|nr:hypothetical protein [Burkholderia pyrrocinia]UOB54358.1 hypothetical protein MRS60_10630 [Burkholderia pyrrocinia]
MARLLHSEDARLRYAALPILDVKYLHPDQVRDESNRLLSDKELDIRDGASQALRGLEASGAEPQKALSAFAAESASAARAGVNRLD